MDLVTIAAFPNSAEAALARNLLESEGIKAFVEEAETGDLFHLAGPLGDVKVQVEVRHAEQARAVLDSAQRHELDDDVEKDAEEAAGSSPEDETSEPA
jgi:hypothetical protein